MGFIGSLFGTRHGSSGGAGLNFRGLSAEPIQSVGTNDTGQILGQAQGGIGQQQALINALRGQNAIENQSGILGQQQGLANLLAAQSLGYGPNPALAQLAQTTGQNVQQQAALAAGQRGSGANAGLLARQIGQQGAGIQQQAVGQAAVLRAQQQLAAQQALQQQQQMMAGLTTQQVGQLGAGIQNYNAAAQNEQQILQNALAQYNAARIQNAAQQNAANAQVSAHAAEGQQSMFGGLLSGLSATSALSGAGGAAGGGGGGGGGLTSQAGSEFLSMGYKGGQVKGYAEGDEVTPDNTGPLQFGKNEGIAEKFFNDPANLPSQSTNIATPTQQSNGPMSFVGKFLNGMTGQQPKQQQPDLTSPSAYQNPAPMVDTSDFSGAHKIFKGAESQGKDIRTAATMGYGAAYKGGHISGESYANKMKPIPGKAKTKGDNLKNDTVPAMLSPGEVIIPRSVMKSNDPVGNAAKFVEAVMAKKRK